MTLLASLLAGCTWSDGVGFTTLSVFRVDSVLPESWQTDLGYEIALTEAKLTTETLSLDALSGGAASFDPQNPPPGYSLCHNGHCHADDGSLPSYAEIEAQLAGDSAEWVAVVYSEGQEIDWRAGDGVAQPEVLPSPELPLTEIGRVSLSLSRALLSGSVGKGSGEIPLSIELDLDAVATGSLGLTIDRRSPVEIAIEGLWAAPDDWFDAIPFDTLAQASGVRIEPSSEAASVLAERLAASPLQVDWVAL